MVNEKFIELKELCKLIHACDLRTAKKWCKERDIPVIKIGSKKMTYRFLIQTELDKVIIQKFKKSSPETWEELYKSYLDDDYYGYLVKTENQVYDNKPLKINKVKPKSRFAKMFADN